MTDPPATIEIAIPYVGSVGFLRKAVESVLRQNDPDWSLFVLVDGPEQPDVESWLSSLGDRRVRYERSTANLGIARSFQRCLESGRSSHITILGCDDLLLPSYVGVVRRALQEHPFAAAVLPGTRVIDGRGEACLPLADRIKVAIAPRRSRTQIRCMGGPGLLSSLMIGNWTYFPLTCWSRESAMKHGFRLDLHVALDLALWADLVLDGGSLALPATVAGCYRRHDASASATSATDMTRFAEEASVHRAIAAQCRDRGWKATALLARLRPTSRLHASLHLWSALRRLDLHAAKSVVRFVAA